MEHSTTPHYKAIPGFEIDVGARAMIVAEGDDGMFVVKPVAHGQSLVNIRTELLDHLNAGMFSDGWLEMLRDYCIGRLAARKEAQATGGVMVPRTGYNWTILHLDAKGGAA